MSPHMFGLEVPRVRCVGGDAQRCGKIALDHLDAETVSAMGARFAVKHGLANTGRLAAKRNGGRFAWVSHTSWPTAALCTFKRKRTGGDEVFAAPL